MTDKAPDAYRTISEVGDDLDIAQHVLRFWETRFPQIKPLKRGGGRRYYRPDDVEMLKGIRHLLYREGYTIKGVQRILREQGPKGVIAVGKSGSLAALGGHAPAFHRSDEEAEASPVSPSPAAIRSALPEQNNLSREIAAVAEMIRPAMPSSLVQAPPQSDSLAAPSLFEVEQSPLDHPAAGTATPAGAQVSFLRGGIHRGDGGAASPTMESTSAIDRRARLRLALAELEASQAMILQYRQKGS